MRANDGSHVSPLTASDIAALPGGDDIAQGLDDLAAGRETVRALVVAIGADQLRTLGVTVPPVPWELPGNRLFNLLATTDPDAARAWFDAWLVHLRTFERALEQRSHERRGRRGRRNNEEAADSKAGPWVPAGWGKDWRGLLRALGEWGIWIVVAVLAGC